MEYKSRAITGLAVFAVLTICLVAFTGVPADATENVSSDNIVYITDYSDDGNTPEQQLRNAVTSAENIIILQTDVMLTGQLVINQNITIDGAYNGNTHTISVDSNTEDSAWRTGSGEKYNYAIKVNGNASVTFKNLNVDANYHARPFNFYQSTISVDNVTLSETMNYSSCAYSMPSGSINLNGGSITVGDNGLRTDGGVVISNEGTFNAKDIVGTGPVYNDGIGEKAYINITNGYSVEAKVLFNTACFSSTNEAIEFFNGTSGDASVVAANISIVKDDTVI